MDELCTACLCNGRNLYFIGETGSYQLYTDILKEIPTYEVPEICLRVCWECRSLLRRFQVFKLQVQRSYSQLLNYILLPNTTTTHEIKSEIYERNADISMPPHLKIHHVININYPTGDIKSENYDDPPSVDCLKSEGEDLHCEDCVKSEGETLHCERTFVNDLQAPVKGRRRKKEDKKQHKKKVKKKRKLRKEIPLSDESIQLERSDGLSDLDSVLEYYEDSRLSEIVDNKTEIHRDHRDKSVLKYCEDDNGSEIENKREIEIDNEDKSILKYCKDDKGSEIENKRKIEINNEDKSDLEYYEDGKETSMKYDSKTERDNKLGLQCSKGDIGGSEIGNKIEIEIDCKDKSDLGYHPAGKDNETKNRRKTERVNKVNKLVFKHYGDARKRVIENKRGMETDNKEKEISEEVIKTQKKNGEVKLKMDKSKRTVISDKPQCVECGKIFSSKKTYRYHLNVLHKGQNQYPCPRCDKVYQWKSNLGRHMRSHKARDTGELYCAMCDKRFASVATYRQHLKVSRRHVSESEFTFSCNDCGKKFVNKTRLRDHIDWEHLNKIKFRCHQCHKPFKCHTSLYVHEQNVHRNKEKKDNLCHVCGKSYQNAAKLKYHIVAMHTSETPYRCPQCAAAFGWYSSLYRHLREVHYKMKVQPKKTKKSKKPPNEVLPSLIPQQQIVLPNLYQAGPP